MYWGNRTLNDARDSLAGYQKLIAKRLAEARPLYIKSDPVLGWRNETDSVHPRWGYGTNSLGNRRSCSDESIYLRAGLGKVALVGNSYVHGDESPDEDTWGWKLQEKMGDDFAIHNLGVSAYSTDQAVMRFVEFCDSVGNVDAAILALTTTDLYRNLNMCRAFIMNDREVPLFKPRYSFETGQAVVHGPVASNVDQLVAALSDPAKLELMRRYDYFYPGVKNQACQILRRFRVPVPSEWSRFFNDGVEVMVQISRLFSEICQERGIKPVILLFPVFWGAFPAGREFDLLKQTCSAFADVIDGRELFTAERMALPSEQIHHSYNHYAPAASDWLADMLCQYLRKLL